MNDILPESKKLYGTTIPELLDKYLKFDGMTLIMFDLETLGLNPKYEYEQITELAAWAVRGDDLEILEKLNYKVNLSSAANTLLSDPNSLERLNWERRQRRRSSGTLNDPNDILKMTRYYEINSPVEKESYVVSAFIEFVEKYPNPVLVAHNAGFDVKFVTARGERYEIVMPTQPVLDTLKISRYFFAPALQTLTTDETELMDALARQRGERIHISSKLGDLAHAFKLNAEYWHTASADVEMMFGVLGKMCEFLGKHRELNIKKYQKQAIIQTRGNRAVNS